MVDVGPPHSNQDPPSPSVVVVEVGVALGVDSGRPDNSPDGPPTIDHLNCVTFSFGANRPGRVPRRTNSVGATDSAAIAARVAPSPSRFHRSDRPSTSRPAPVAA